MPISVLEAIKMGIWDYEPPEVDDIYFDPADAMPGTKDKLQVLAERAKNGLPLWHNNDREDMESEKPGRVRKPR